MIRSPLPVGQLTVLRFFELISHYLVWHIKWLWNSIYVNLLQLEVFILPLDIMLVVFWLKNFGGVCDVSLLLYAAVMAFHIKLFFRHYFVALL